MTNDEIGSVVCHTTVNVADRLTVALWEGEGDAPERYPMVLSRNEEDGMCMSIREARRLYDLLGKALEMAVKT